MATLPWAVLAASALLLHEYLAARAVANGRRVVYMRRALLLLALGAVVVIGPTIQSRVSEAWKARPPRAVPFDSSGDPLAVRALEEQSPEHPFPVNGPRADADAWRARILDALAARADLAFARQPAPSNVPFTAADAEMVGTIRRTLIRFAASDGTPIPAYVLDPGGATRKGGVLVIPGHGPGIAATSGLRPGYEHSAALEMARRGYVVLTPELRGFGMLSPSRNATHRLVAAAALAAGSSYKALVARDLQRALTVLQEWPGVDPGRLAVTGTSLGGELAVLMGALDERVRVTVSNSYGGAIGATRENERLDDESRQTPHGCHTMPGINRILRQEDWVRLIAPRPVLVVRGDRNMSRQTPEFKRLVSLAFESHGVASHFDVTITPGRHEFFVDPTEAFIARWLQ